MTKTERLWWEAVQMNGSRGRHGARLLVVCGPPLIALIGTALRAEDGGAVKAIAAVKPAVVRVIAWNTTVEPLSFGTGFVADREGFVVTSADVVKGAGRISVLLDDDKEFTVKVAGVDEDHNLALLKLPIEVPRAVSFDRSAAEEGTHVLVTGYGIGADEDGGGLEVRALTTRSVVAAIRPAQSFVEKEPMKLMEIAAEFGPGSSGAPVYRQDTGAVIAVLSGEPRASFLDEVELNLAVPVEHVFALAKAVREGKAAKQATAADRVFGPIKIERQRLMDVPVPDETEIEAAGASLPGGGLAVRAEGGQMLADPERPRVYVTERKLNALAVIDTEENRVEKRLLVGAQPVGMALSPDNSTLYVAASGDSHIALVDLERLALKGITRVGFQPFDIACPQRDRLYLTGLTEASGGTTHVVDLRSKVRLTPRDMRQGHVGLGALVVVHPGAPGVVFGNTRMASICRFADTAEGFSHKWRKNDGEGSHLRHMRLSPNGKLLYACFRSYDHVLVLESKTLIPLGRLDTGPHPDRVAPSPDGSKVFATHGKEHVDVFDAKTFLKIGSFPAESKPINLTVSGDSKKLAVAFPNGVWVRSVDQMGQIAGD